MLPSLLECNADISQKANALIETVEFPWLIAKAKFMGVKFLHDC